MSSVTVWVLLFCPNRNRYLRNWGFDERNAIYIIGIKGWNPLNNKAFTLCPLSVENVRSRRRTLLIYQSSVLCMSFICCRCFFFHSSSSVSFSFFILIENRQFGSLMHTNTHTHGEIEANCCDCLRPVFFTTSIQTNI